MLGDRQPRTGRASSAARVLSETTHTLAHSTALPMQASAAHNGCLVVRESGKRVLPPSKTCRLTLCQQESRASLYVSKRSRKQWQAARRRNTNTLEASSLEIECLYKSNLHLHQITRLLLVRAVVIGRFVNSRSGPAPPGRAPQGPRKTPEKRVQKTQGPCTRPCDPAKLCCLVSFHDWAPQPAHCFEQYKLSLPTFHSGVLISM